MLIRDAKLHNTNARDFFVRLKNHINNLGAHFLFFMFYMTFVSSHTKWINHGVSFEQSFNKQLHLDSSWNQIQILTCILLIFPKLLSFFILYRVNSRNTQNLKYYDISSFNHRECCTSAIVVIILRKCKGHITNLNRRMKLGITRVTMIHG